MTFICNWYNFLKVIELVYDPKADRYSVSDKNRKAISHDNVFLAGSSLFEV